MGHGCGENSLDPLHLYTAFLRDIQGRTAPPVHVVFAGSACLLLLPRHPLDVELELLALEQEAVASAALAGPRRDARKQAASVELRVEVGVEHTALLASSDLLLHTFRLLLLLLLCLTLRILFLEVLLAHNATVMRLVPLAEGRRINLHDGVLHEGLRANQLVVGRVVDDVEDTRLACAYLRAPGEVARVQAHRPELGVATAATHSVHTLCANLRHRHLPTHLILALLVVNWFLATSEPALVQ